MDVRPTQDLRQALPDTPHNELVRAPFHANRSHHLAQVHANHVKQPISTASLPRRAKGTRHPGHPTDAKRAGDADPRLSYLKEEKKKYPPAALTIQDYHNISNLTQRITYDCPTQDQTIASLS